MSKYVMGSCLNCHICYWVVFNPSNKLKGAYCTNKHSKYYFQLVESNFNCDKFKHIV